MKPSLGQRLKWGAVDHETAAATSDPAMIARFGTYLFASGATLGLLLVLLPHPGSMSEAGMLLTSLASYAGGAVLIGGFDRLPSWAYQLLVGFGTLCITGGMHFYGGDVMGAVVVLYVTIAISAFYFFTWQQAALQSLFIAVAYAAVLLAHEPLGSAAAAWLVTVGMIVVVGILMGFVRSRVEWLVSRLEDAARADPLTGLLNRRGFTEVFELELERALRSDRKLSLLVGDLDRFREVNDRFGHQSGDNALEQVSSIIEKSKRKVDAAARVGGEEFALVLTDTDENGSYILAERLRNQIRDRFAAEPVKLTMSFGIASFPAHGHTSGALLRAGDQALYAAKALGRNRSVIHSAEIAGTVSAVPPDGDQDGHIATVLALAETLEVRYSGTAKHSRAVADYAELTARELGLPDQVVERVRLAGLLHDVGMVGVPDSVLKKAGPLTDEEWVMIKKHPYIAARILDGTKLDDVRDWVLAHQERPDGDGYPRGLRGEEIPLEARIVAVADAYDAMTSNRTYRPALSHEAAQTELLKGAGKQFDSEVVDVFLRLLGRRGAAVGSRTAA